MLISLSERRSFAPFTKLRRLFSLDNIKQSVLFSRIFYWEFWPFWMIYWPFVPYWVWLSIKTRSFFFFTAANPGIQFGGMMGESKKDIYDKLPKETIPLTLKFSSTISKQTLLNRLKKVGLEYPFILKPDVGQRGWMVEKINCEEELDHYLSKVKVDFLAQELIDYPIELGIFYHRLPEEEKGEVTSIVKKEMLTVKGDGRQTVSELIDGYPRALMQKKAIEEKSPGVLDYIPKSGEKKEIVSIGNHSRGTTFLNGNDLINEDLELAIDQLSKSIDGFYFGRFDLRCRSIADLRKSKRFKIIELNGASAEPAHIYHPGRSIWLGYRDIAYHLDRLAEIGKANRDSGISYMSTSDGIKELRRNKRYNSVKTLS